MKNPLNDRSIVSPFLATAFAAVATTGVLMYLNVANGAIVKVHEYMGLALVAVGVAHAVANFKPLAGYFKNTTAKVAVAVAVSAIVVLAIIGLRGGEEREERPAKPEVKALGERR